MSDDDQFNRWLQEVAALEANDDVKFDAQNYRDVLSELGYSPSELERVATVVDDCVRRGQKFAEFKRWSDAVSAYERAIALAPWSMNSWIELARAYLEEFRLNGEARNSQACERWARKHIEAAPEDEAGYSVLNELDQLRARAAARPRSLRSKHRLYFIVCAGLILMASAIVMIPADGHDRPSHKRPIKSSKGAPAEDRAKAPKEPPVRYVSEQTSRGPIVLVQPNIPPAVGDIAPGVYGLPMTVDGNGRLGDVRLDASLNRLEISDYEDRHTARIRMRLINLKGGPLEALGGTLNWLDSDGQILGSKQITFISTADAAIRIGEQYAYGSAHHGIPRGTVAVHMQVMATTRGVEQSQWPAATPLCVRWNANQPKGVNVDFKVRSLKQSLLHRRYEVEARNQGQAPIRSLVVGITLYDSADEPIGNTGEIGVLSRRIIAGGWEPPFLVGELRTMAALLRVSEDDARRVKRVCLRVVEVQ